MVDHMVDLKSSLDHILEEHRLFFIFNFSWLTSRFLLVEERTEEDYEDWTERGLRVRLLQVTHP